MAKMEAHLEHLIEDIKELKLDLKEHIIWEQTKYEDMDKKYAPKWVQWVTVTAIGGLAIFSLEILFGAFTKIIGG